MRCDSCGVEVEVIMESVAENGRFVTLKLWPYLEKRDAWMCDNCTEELAKVIEDWLWAKRRPEASDD